MILNFNEHATNKFNIKSYKDIIDDLFVELYDVGYKVLFEDGDISDDGGFKKSPILRNAIGNPTAYMITFYMEIENVSNIVYSIDDLDILKRRVGIFKSIDVYSIIKKSINRLESSGLRCSFEFISIENFAITIVSANDKNIKYFNESKKI